MRFALNYLAVIGEVSSAGPCAAPQSAVIRVDRITVDGQPPSTVGFVVRNLFSSGTQYGNFGVTTDVADALQASASRSSSPLSPLSCVMSGNAQALVCSR